MIASTVRADLPSHLGVGHILVSSKILQLRVARPQVELFSQPESIRRGGRKPIVWTNRHHTPLEGEAGVTLVGLPKGVFLCGPSPTINRESATVTFHLEATNEALLGQVRELMCEVRVLVEGQRLVQATGRGTLRIDSALAE